MGYPLMHCGAPILAGRPARGEKDKLDTRDPALRHCDPLDTRDCTFGRVGHEIVDNAILVCIRPNSLRIMAYQDRSEALEGGDIVLRACPAREGLTADFWREVARPISGAIVFSPLK